jgi:hypothetical protein
MLARPEIGSYAHIILWVASKPPGEQFYWRDAQHCACGQYSREFFGHVEWTALPKISPIAQLNDIAYRVAHPHSGIGTFGALHARLVEKWRHHAGPA